MASSEPIDMQLASPSVDKRESSRVKAQLLINDIKVSIEIQSEFHLLILGEISKNAEVRRLKEIHH